MKILHTSDWHLGQTLHEQARTEEQEHMLRQMNDLVRKEQPDAFVLSGDIFHTGQPSAAVQKMFADTMVRLHETCPGMVIVCTAGNHDSASRHEVFRQPWLSLQVHSIGLLDKEHPENHIVRLPGKGYIIALPYCYERNIPRGFIQDLLDTVEAQNAERLPVVMMAHTTLENADLRGHKMGGNSPIGGIETMTVSQTGHGYDYLALGHIHHAQWVKADGRYIRYCGSPLPVSFDEDYEHSVTVVNMRRHGEAPEVRTVPIVNPRPLVTLPPHGFACWEKVRTLLADFPQDIPAYVRLNIEGDSLTASDLQSEAEALVESKSCRICFLNFMKHGHAGNADETMSVEEFRQESPVNIARMYAERQGILFDSDMENMLNEIIKSIDTE